MVKGLFPGEVCSIRVLTNKRADNRNSNLKACPRGEFYKSDIWFIQPNGSLGILDYSDDESSLPHTESQFAPALTLGL